MKNNYTIIITNYEIDLYDCDPFEIEALSEGISINYSWDDYELSISGSEAEVKETLAVIFSTTSFEKSLEYAKRHDYGVIEVRNGFKKVLL